MTIAAIYASYAGSDCRSELLCILRRTKLNVGGLMMSLKRPVPYTSKANPATCSHLNDSQPRPRLTIQINSVLHVSIVLRGCAYLSRD